MNTNQWKMANKGIIDIIMVLGLIGCFIATSVFEESKEALKNGAEIESVFSWGASHCIISIVLVCVVLIHIWQHWNFHKLLITKKLYLKNKLTSLTILIFILTVISIILYLAGFTFFTLHFHSIVAHIFVFVVIIHFITNFKKLINLFKRVPAKE